MSTSGEQNKVAIAAGADLSALQYRVIDVAGTLGTNNSAALGVLLNKPKVNESAAVAFSGHMKAYCGGTISAGNRLKAVASGYVTAVAAVASGTAPDGSIGKALKAATSGSLVEFIGDFSTAFTTDAII